MHQQAIGRREQLSSTILEAQKQLLIRENTRQMHTNLAVFYYTNEW